MRYVLLIIFILAIAIAGGVSLSVVTEPYAYGEVSFTTATTASLVIPPLPLLVLFTGDVMLARRAETLMDTYGGDFPYRRLPHLRELADTVIVNFEAAAPRSHVHTPDLTFRFSVDSLYVASLRAAGVTHAGLANNHAQDTGMLGFEETNQVLRENDIVPFGAASVASTSVITIEQAGTAALIVAINLVDEELSVEALEKLLNAASSTDYQIAYIHWGSEYQNIHNATQEQAAKQLVTLGFDAIVGHHPHVVQDIDVLEGVPVFYSLGNFIFDQYFSAAVQEGLLVQLEVSPEALTFNLLPHTSFDARTQPQLLEGEEKAAYLQKIAQFSAASIQNGIVRGALTFTRKGCNSCVID